MAVPLSDREQRILAEIERGLSAEDPRWAQTITEHEPAPHLPHLFRRGALLFGAGVGLLVAFLVSRLVVVGVAAFGLMVAGLVVGVGAASGWVKESLMRNVSETTVRTQYLRRFVARWDEALRRRYRRH